MQAAADRERAERRKRHEIRVKGARPIDEPVATGVANQNIATRAAERDVLVACCSVGGVVGAAVRVEIVVAVEQVVVEIVAARAADDPIVAEIAEDAVVAVAEHGLAGGIDARCDALAGVEVEQEVRSRLVVDSGARVELVVGRELERRRVEAEHIVCRRRRIEERR